MRRLLLLRHAKSSWAEEGLSDFDRPLEQRGRRAAEWLGEEIAAAGLAPAMILCSAARRTRETLAGLLPHLAGEPRIRLTRRLYDEASNNYRYAIAELGGSAPSLMVIGHNPAVAATLSLLTGSGDRALLRKLDVKYPTGGLVVVDFTIDDWAAIEAKSGRLVGFLDPRTMPGADRDAD